MSVLVGITPGGAASCITAFLRAGQERQLQRQPGHRPLPRRPAHAPAADGGRRRKTPRLLGDAAAATPSFVLWGDSTPRPCAPVSTPPPERVVSRATSPAGPIARRRQWRSSSWPRAMAAVGSTMRCWPCWWDLGDHHRRPAREVGKAVPWHEISWRAERQTAGPAGKRRRHEWRRCWGPRAGERRSTALERLARRRHRRCARGRHRRAELPRPGAIHAAGSQIDLHLADYMQRNAAVLRMVRNISVGPT